MNELSEGQKIAQALFSANNGDKAETVTDALCLIADALSNPRTDDATSIAESLQMVSESISEVASAIRFATEPSNGDISTFKEELDNHAR